MRPLPRTTRWPVAAAILGAAAPLAAQPAGPPTAPDDTAGIGITEHLGDRLPMDLAFRDDHGQPVTLRDLFAGDRPVALALVYYTCPGICNALLNGMTQAFTEMPLVAGRDFTVVAVSIDPTETPELAAGKKSSYLEYYGHPDAADGWHFLVGEQPAIETLATAAGFGYRYEPGTGLYTHAASLMLCTPDGRLSRYLNDVVFEPRTLELAVTEASQGTIGSPVEHLLLWCYTYDPSSGRYVVAARKVMAIGGAVTVLLTAAGLAALWRHEHRVRRDGAATGEPA